jgi:predicted component of type VI protein secretion system
MKKILALLATLCLATLLIAGCGGSDKKAAPQGADKKVTLKSRR